MQWYYKNMTNAEYRKTIYEYAPSLRYLSFTEFNNALNRMAIAYVLNGGSYIGLHETAVQYLKQLARVEKETLRRHSSDMVRAD